MPRPTATSLRLRALRVNRPRAEAFSFADDRRDVAYDWHRHPHHQLLYSFSGVARVETAGALWLLPPQRAAWIPAGLRHRTVLRNATVGSVYFDPRRYPWPDRDAARVLPAPPLLRELAAYAMRWTNRPRREAERRLAESFFDALALLCGELARQAPRFVLPLPRGRSPAVRAAVDYALAHLDTADMAGAARAAAQSERTLRRRFREETGLNWNPFLLRARMLRAVELLDAGERNVTETALEVGFSSLSAFGRAFAAFTGEKPNAFRRRAREISPRPSGPTGREEAPSPSTPRRRPPGAPRRTPRGKPRA